MARRNVKQDQVAARLLRGLDPISAAIDIGIETLAKSPEDRLQWLNEFLERTSLSAEDCDVFATQLNWFLYHHYRAWGGSYKTAAYLNRIVAPAELRDIQKSVDVLLKALEPEGRLVELPRAIVDGLQWCRDGVVLVTATPGLPQVLSAVADLLRTFGNRLRRCETPSCRRLFAYKRPGQKRCRVSCGSADRMRAWREQHRNEVADQRHQRYVKEVQKKSPGAKVQRRGQKASRHHG